MHDKTLRKVITFSIELPTKNDWLPSDNKDHYCDHKSRNMNISRPQVAQLQSAWVIEVHQLTSGSKNLAETIHFHRIRSCRLTALSYLLLANILAACCANPVRLLLIIN